MKVIVTGASGFVGKHAVVRLANDGHQVVGLIRGDATEYSAPANSVQYIGGIDVTDPSTMSPEAFAGADAVLHLVGIIAERPPAQTFARIHVQGTRNVVDAARPGGVGNVVYISAVGAAPEAASEYSRTKFAAEEIVRASGLRYSVLRPSIILGSGGEFVEQMQDLVRYGGLPVRVAAPVIPVPGNGKTLFQPIFIDDLTACIAGAVAGRRAENATVALGGADRVSFDGIVEAFEKAEKVSKPLLHIPLPVLAAVAPIVEKLPKPPFSADQLKNLGIDNVADLEAMRAAFGFTPLAFEQIMQKIAL